MQAAAAAVPLLLDSQKSERELNVGAAMLPSCGLLSCSVFLAKPLLLPLSAPEALLLCIQRHKMIFPTSSWLWPNGLQHREKKAQWEKTERSGAAEGVGLFIYLVGSF